MYLQGRKTMIINDINYLETANEEVFGGSVEGTADVYTDVYNYQIVDTYIYDYVYSYVDIYGNAADAFAVSDAYGYDTKTVTSTATEATEYSSGSYSFSGAYSK